MNVITFNAVRDALLTFERIEPGRTYGRLVEYKILEILTEQGFSGPLHNSIAQIEVMLNRLTAPPKVTPDDVLAILIALNNAYMQEITYEQFAAAVNVLAHRLVYPDKARLERVVKTHLGELDIRVNCLPHFKAADTLAALDEYNEQHFDYPDYPYATTPKIAMVLTRRLGFRVPHPLWSRELENVIDIHLMQKRNLVDKIRREYEYGHGVWWLEYCTLACLKRHGFHRVT
jgi:hypothetical protein